MFKVIMSYSFSPKSTYHPIDTGSLQPGAFVPDYEGQFQVVHDKSKKQHFLLCYERTIA